MTTAGQAQPVRAGGHSLITGAVQRADGAWERRPSGEAESVIHLQANKFEEPMSLDGA